MRISWMSREQKEEVGVVVGGCCRLGHMFRFLREKGAGFNYG